ncbi:hypothetical protein [Bdellovibrio reynosensis]|uniref:Uncharacterized protein n=1 Tax=Bdellovibrio reynosensis TaxID=2835041 RepID=A0ABY4C5W0_9BACT|nr:hypothetical protein [Bdellovibrio reynosensis]UOF00270.1 hypothetical protein MNR06_11215 [Bdellovibrio reynosensis]
MKKAFVFGAIFLASSIGMAAPVKTSRELLKDYTKQIKEFMYKGGTAKSLESSSAAHKEIIKQINIPGKSFDLEKSLSNSGSASRIESMMTVLAAKKLSTEIIKTDAVEGKSMLESADATAKLIANNYLRDANKPSELGTNLELVTKTLDKMENELPAKILVDFSVTERAAYVKIIEKYDLLNNSPGAKRAEDNFVQAIMEVKKVDRTKALELVKKLKECV